MKTSIRLIREEGFSLTEFMVSLLILASIMGAVVNLVWVAVNQHASEQNAIDVNQTARSGLDLMRAEISQAGSHGDKSTTAASAITASVDPQTVSVASSAGFTTGDYISVGTGSNNELVKITATGSNTISGIFRTGHASGIPIRLFALPYLRGVIPPSGLGVNSSVTVTTIKLFGDMNGDGTIYYVEYAYDSTNAQITRSVTPITQTTKSTGQPIVSQIKAGSLNFTLYTDGLGVVTSVHVGFTVQGTWKSGAQNQETALATRIVIPSAVAASALLHEIQVYGGTSRLPTTPSQVTTWAQ